MLKKGAHLRDVQHALGHTELSSTQRYVPLLVNDLREAMGGVRIAQVLSSAARTPWAAFSSFKALAVRVDKRGA